MTDVCESSTSTTDSVAVGGMAMRFWHNSLHAISCLAVGAIIALLMIAPPTEAQAEVPSQPTIHSIESSNGELRVSVYPFGWPWPSPVIPASSLRVQWKSGEQDYDSSRQEDSAINRYALRTDVSITGLTNGVEYTVRVIAKNEDGDSQPSFESTATPARDLVAEADATLGHLWYTYDFESCGHPLGTCASRGSFSTDRTTHSLEVRPSTESLTISATPTRSRATVAYAPADADETAIYHQVSLAEDENVITVTVTSEDGSATSTHTITVTRPANTAPTGVPSISGTARVFERLTASVSGIADEDGLDDATFAYQWIRTDGTTDTDIPGATQATYRPGADDQGKTIKVRTTFVDDGGTEEVLTSAATSVVEESLLLSVANARVQQAIDETAEFTVTLSRAASHTVTADWATAEGTATAGQDYTAASGTLSFAPGETTKTVSIAMLNDTVEVLGAFETFVLRLSNAVGALFADSEATGTILSDAASRETVPPSVRVQCVNTEATSERHEERQENAQSGELTPIYPGPQVDNSKTVWWELQFSEFVDRTDDSSAEPFEITGQDDAYFTWITLGGGAGHYLGDYEELLRYSTTPKGSGGAESEVSGVVINVPAGGWHDQAGNLNTASSNSLYLAHNWKVSVADANAHEGTNPTIDFEVTLNARDDCKTVTVDWATMDGTATADDDYTAANGTLTFAPGETSKTVSVAVIDDTDIDSGETFTLRLSNASTVTPTGVKLSIADGEAVGTIFNSESPFNSLPQIAGVAQVGNTLEVSFTEAPSGALNYQWLRGSETIAGATASTYAPTAADVGTKLAVRVASGDESLTSAPTAPVWAAPANPALADGEEELLSTTLTLGWHQFRLWNAGYGRILGQSYGEMDVTTFDDGGATYSINALLINADGKFMLATGATLPEAAGLVAYWNGYRISGLATSPTGEGSSMLLVGNSPQPKSEYNRYDFGASDGVRVAVSLRRVSVAAQAALTATFTDPPARHEGAAADQANAIELTLELSEEPADGFSYKVFQGDSGAGRPSSLRLTNATLVRAWRDGTNEDGTEQNRKWKIKVDPTNGHAVTVTLPATTDCVAQNAICNGDGAMLATAVTVTIPGPDTPEPQGSESQEAEQSPFAVSFKRSPPAEHDGSAAFSFTIAFNDDLEDGFSYTTLRDAFAIAQGGTALTPRVVRGESDEAGTTSSNRVWWVKVTPSGPADVSIGMPTTSDCAAQGALCTDDGRALSTTFSAIVQGPPGLSVANARVEEAAGATLDFAVTLSRSVSETVTVAYATSDGSATAGEDYTSTSGTLTFNAGETSKTVSVSVLNDDHDEGEEKFTLTLSDVSGGNAYLKDATATGTIENKDVMPQAWLARFGRTVADHVADAIGNRLRSSQQVQVVLGGQNLQFDQKSLHNANLMSSDLRLSDGSSGLILRSLNDYDWKMGKETPRQYRELEMSELLLASSFHLASSENLDAGSRWSMWGRGSRSSFEGREDSLTLSGDVTTATLGIDLEWKKWLVGLALAHSSGDGSFEANGSCVVGCEGKVESTLTGVYPYARYRVSDKLALWGMLGHGQGALTLNPSGVDLVETDVEMSMAAVGARGVLLPAKNSGGLELALRTDMLMTSTGSEAVPNLVETEAETSRFRLLLEGSRAFRFGADSVLTPSFQVGLRHDGGDAETGGGLEVGGSLHYAAPSKRLTIEVSARSLLTHQESDYKEWGVSGTVRIDPGERGRGISMRLGSAWGSPSNGAEQLWAQRYGGFSARSFDPETSFDAEVAYGLDAPRGLLTPYTGLAVSENGETWRAGARWKIDPAFDVSVEASLRESSGDEKPESGLLLRGSKRW